MIFPWHLVQELSYRNQIARQLHSQYIEGRPKYYTVTLKSRLRVTQDHRKGNHWIDHTWLTISKVIWHWILSWPWNVGRGHSRSSKVVPFECLGMVSYSPSIVIMAISDICSHLRDIQHQRMAWPWNLGLGRSRSLKMARFDRPCITFY